MRNKAGHGALVLAVVLGGCLIGEAQTASVPADGGAGRAAASGPVVGGVAPAAAAGVGWGGGGPQAPASAADVAEMEKLKELPAYGAGLGDGDYSVGPNYKVAAEDVVKPGNPRGKMFRFTLNSADSKIFPATPPFTRAVSVYVPAQYVPGTEVPFIISCDQYGLSERTGHFQNVLDTMIADKRLPVMCAVMVASGGNQASVVTGASQRSMEYDTMWGKYSDYVEEEVLPRAEKEAGIKLTKDPEGRMTYGGSSGGIAALSMAWFHPERYHKVAAYSATLVALRRTDAFPKGGWEYPEHLIADNPAKPLRIWLETAETDNGSATASAEFRNWVIANARTAAGLKAKGYHYQFVYAKNAGHTDSKVMSDITPQALEFIWKGYPIAGAK